MGGREAGSGGGHGLRVLRSFDGGGMGGDGDGNCQCCRDFGHWCQNG